ncbi:MAG: response regulator [Candidatus Omnitrophica bacterium]|nr:response regulator [Candidatus Omnitrophota bacterium]
MPIEKLPDNIPPEAVSILIIDDDRSVREMMYEILSENGFQCLIAASGAEAIDLLKSRKGPIGGAIVDLEMRGMDGIQTFRELRRITQGLKVILMSGYHAPIQMDLLKDGFAGFLPKPFDIQNLLSIVNRIFLNR